MFILNILRKIIYGSSNIKEAENKFDHFGYIGKPCDIHKYVDLYRINNSSIHRPINESPLNNEYIV